MEYSKHWNVHLRSMWFLKIPKNPKNYFFIPLEGTIHTSKSSRPENHTSNQILPQVCSHVTLDFWGLHLFSPWNMGTTKSRLRLHSRLLNLKQRKFGVTPARWWVLFIFFQLSINQVWGLKLMMHWICDCHLSNKLFFLFEYFFS